MALQAGTRLGPYEVTALLGEGGMGQVYRATDTNLSRQVAIKVLPAAFATDPERLARFEREAKTLASLSHPNIAIIHGFEKGEGIRALVMELVEGPTLADRIAQGPIPVDEALPIAKQIAEALEAAHEQGIIHRDLKPANVKLRPDGAVKVLDFGLAKALEPVSANADATASPTITSPAMMTGVGILLGTAAYMSPEQARGKPVDKRSDVWAFGCVLFEMLTGRRAFDRDDITETLADVLRVDPNWALLPRGLSPALVAFLKQSLHKDARQRIPDIAAMRLVLEGTFDFAGSDAAFGGTPTRMSRVAVWSAVAGLAVVLIAGMAWIQAGGGVGRGPLMPARVSIALPTDRPAFMTGFPSRSIALSPDGTQVVYLGRDEADASVDRRGLRLFVRSLTTRDVRALPGTADARTPFFSPDGRWVGFFTTTGELRKVSLLGGNAVTVAKGVTSSNWAFGVWANDDTIFFGSVLTGLRQVSSEGGAIQDLTQLDESRSEFGHMFPTLLRSGRTVLFSNVTTGGGSRIEGLRLDSGERRVVLEDAGSPVVLDNGDLLFERDGNLLASAFDSETLTLTGPMVSLDDQVQFTSAQGTVVVPELAVSRDGTLAYFPAGDEARVLGLVDRAGQFAALPGPAGPRFRPRVSPEGHTVAFVTEGTQADVYLLDLVRGSVRQLTQGAGARSVAWHPSGRSIAVEVFRPETSGIVLKDLLSGQESILVGSPATGELKAPSWSPDGKLAYMVQRGRAMDIWVRDPGETSSPHATIAAPGAAEHSPTFSPDGRWLAYASNESGRYEIYVQRFPTGEREVVSIEGGVGPVWGRDGRELFFQGTFGGIAKMLKVRVSVNRDSLVLGKPEPLFDLEVLGPEGPLMYPTSSNAGPAYDVLPDGRFVIARGPDSNRASEIVLVLNFFEELKRLKAAD